MSLTVTHEELAGLVQRITEAAQALISGDIEGYAARIKHAHDYTLMSPYGGELARGFDDSDGALDALAQFFRGGEAKVEVVETYRSGDLAVLAGDANPRRYAGRSLTSYDLAKEYGVTDTDGSQPNCWGYIDAYGIDEQSGRGVEEFR